MIKIYDDYEEVPKGIKEAIEYNRINPKHIKYVLINIQNNEIPKKLGEHMFVATITDDWFCVVFR